MLKKRFKQYLPNPAKLKEHKSLQIFGDLIHNPNVWHITRYSVARAMSVGLFIAWVPVPFQMVLAAAVAIFCHANLALSVALVWITNPLTMPALYYFAYRVGGFILGTSPNGFHFELSMEWLSKTMQTSWQPFLLGCFVLGVISSVLGNIFIRWAWRIMVVRHWNRRKHKHKKSKK